MIEIDVCRGQVARIRGLVFGLLMLGLLGVAGCGAQPAGPTGRTEDAGKAVSTALDAWKAGKQPDQLKSETPSIHVADEDWQAGKALKGYQMSGAPQKNGGNWRVNAVLTVSDEGQSEQQKTVAYDVTMQPAITVLRAFDVTD
ncbi:MAG: hypothetical protein EXS05_01160 [Planctomycetaceae bacterium]|nr:hypothetical protein [Planctomycetaceae bacterium]